ncbi:MAG: type II toxin-antitoxin system Phd/YefM family antitoxin [Caulobacteraceae bacterium]
MTDIPLAEAKARLSALVERAMAGETVRITRRGKPVAQITAVEKAKRPLDMDAIRAFAASMPHDPEDAGEFVRRMRDDERY